jgi:hypothetical protein
MVGCALIADLRDIELSAVTDAGSADGMVVDAGSADVMADASSPCVPDGSSSDCSPGLTLYVAPTGDDVAGDGALQDDHERPRTRRRGRDDDRARERHVGAVVLASAVHPGNNVFNLTSQRNGAAAVCYTSTAGDIEAFGNTWSCGNTAATCSTSMTPTRINAPTDGGAFTCQAAVDIASPSAGQVKADSPTCCN